MRLIDADAAMKKLGGECIARYPNTFTMGLLAAVREIDNMPTIEQPTWISCAERLPTEEASIEMFFPIAQTICLGYYKKIAKMAFWCINFPDGTGRIADNKPTHWRYRYITETPQPPRGDE